MRRRFFVSFSLYCIRPRHNYCLGRNYWLACPPGDGVTTRWHLSALGQLSPLYQITSARVNIGFLFSEVRMRFCCGFVQLINRSSRPYYRHISALPDSSLGLHIQWVNKKQHTLLLPITSPNVGRFSKFFHHQTQEWLYNEFITKDPIAHMRRYTTLWNLNVQKLIKLAR